MKRVILVIAGIVALTLLALGIQVAYATGACAATNWDAWIKSYQPNVKYNSVLANGSANHSTTMAKSGKLYHDPGLSLPPGGTKVGEIVGYGPASSPQTIQQAFVNSPSHYAILVGKGWTHYGYAVVTDSKGRLWVTVRFATIKTTTAAPKPTPSVVRTSKPAPKPTPTKTKAATTSNKRSGDGLPSGTPTPSPTLTEEPNEKTYRTFPRIDEQPVYTGPIFTSAC